MENKFRVLFLESYSTLKKEDDLSPNNQVVSDVLTKMVDTSNQCYNCLKNIHNCDKMCKIMPEFRDLCAKSECEMEKYWADKLNSKDFLTIKDLKEFWYYDNYELITDKEVKMIKNNIENIENKTLLFVGSGALPLTALIMCMKYNLNITLMDYDKEAVEKSKTLIQKLGLNINVINSNFFNYDTSSYDIVFLASLVSNKQIAIDKIINNKTQNIMTRGADGVYQIFYEDLDPSLKTGMPYSYIPSDSKTLNSSYLFTT